MASGEELMAKKVVRGVMIIQKNDSGWGDPRPPRSSREDLNAQSTQ